jgi:ankyrin repeat protein
MPIKYLLFFSILCVHLPHILSMKQNTVCDTKKILQFSMPEDTWIHIIACCETKYKLRETCRYFYQFASSKNERILQHPSLILSDKALKTLFHYHIALGNTAIVHNLLTQGADPNDSLDDNNMTILQYAAQYGYNDIITLLLESPHLTTADIAKNEQSALFLAIQNNHHTIVDKIITKKPELKNNGNILCFAIEKNSLDSIRVLLAHNFNVNATDSKMTYPLMHAAQFGNAQLTKLLIAHGALVDCTYNASTYVHVSGSTPLHIAAENGHLNVVKILLAHNADVHKKTKLHYTPLHYAAGQRENYHMVRLLLDCNARIDEKGQDEKTPLQYACQTGCLKTVQLLIDRGADVNSRDISQWAPLHYASYHGHDAIVALLLNNGASVNAHATNQDTPLHCACQYRMQNGKEKIITIVSLLIEKKADVNAIDKDGYTPLHYAAEIFYNHTIINLLIQHGADSSLKTHTGKRPADLVDQYDRNNPLKDQCILQ